MQIFIDVDNFDDEVGEGWERWWPLVGGFDRQVVELLHFVVETTRNPDSSGLVVDLKVFLLAVFLYQRVPENNSFLWILTHSILNK